MQFGGDAPYTGDVYAIEVGSLTPLSAPPGSAGGPGDEALFAAKADAEKNAWRPAPRLNRDEATALISAFLAARDRSRVLNRDEAIDDRNAAEYAELQDELLNALTGESK